MAKLVRQRDSLIKEGIIEYLEFDKHNLGKGIHMKPKEGYACIVNRTRMSYAWMTSIIVEVISETEFKTKNSHYKIEN
jgi:hypothetical protein